MNDIHELGNVATNVVIIPKLQFADGDVAVTNCTCVYDGQGHGVGVAVTNAIANAVIRYATAQGGPFGDTAPLFTNVTNATVYVEASAPGYVTQTFSVTATIAAREITASVADLEPKVYDGETAVTATGILSNTVAGDDVSVTAGGNYSDKNVGTDKDVTYSSFTLDGEDKDNYKLTTTSYVAKGTITPATLTITAEAKTKVYGEDDPALTYTTNGLVEGDAISGALERAAGEDVGTYAINQGTLDAGSNYAIVYTGANLTITQATLPMAGGEPGTGTVPEGGLSKFDTTSMYDAAGHTIDTNALVEAFAAAMGGPVDVQYALGDSQAADASTWSPLPPLFTNVGEETVWYSVSNRYYEAYTHSAKVTVTAREATITVDDGTKVYGEADPVFTGSVEGLVGADDLGTIEYYREGTDEDVGTYAEVLMASFTSNDNYVVVLVPGDFTITEAEPDIPLALQDAFDGLGDVASDGDGGWVVTLANDVNGTIDLPDNIGNLSIDLNGHYINGVDGSAGAQPSQKSGGAATPAIRIVPGGEGGSCYEALEASDIYEAYAPSKSMKLYGAVYDGCDVVGIVELKLGKVRKGKGSISGSFIGLDGKRKLIKYKRLARIDGSKPVGVSLVVKDIGSMQVKIGGSRFAGTIGGWHVQTADVGSSWKGTKAMVKVAADDLSAFPGEVVKYLLPFAEELNVDGGEWVSPKAAKIRYRKNKITGVYELSGYDDPKRPNLSAMKLAYKPLYGNTRVYGMPRGTFKGSFKVYSIIGNRLKRYTVTVKGFVVDGVGYGTATRKKLGVTWNVTVEAP